MAIPSGRGGKIRPTSRPQNRHSIAAGLINSAHQGQGRSVDIETFLEGRAFEGGLLKRTATGPAVACAPRGVGSPIDIASATIHPTMVQPRNRLMTSVLPKFGIC